MPHSTVSLLCFIVWRELQMANPQPLTEAATNSSLFMCWTGAEASVTCYPSLPRLLADLASPVLPSCIVHPAYWLAADREIPPPWLRLFLQKDHRDNRKHQQHWDEAGSALNYRPDRIPFIYRPLSLRALGAVSTNWSKQSAFQTVQPKKMNKRGFKGPQKGSCFRSTWCIAVQIKTELRTSEGRTDS